jgi:hypothetical protein
MLIFPDTTKCEKYKYKYPYLVSEMFSEDITEVREALLSL